MYRKSYPWSDIIQARGVVSLYKDLELELITCSSTNQEELENNMYGSHKTDLIVKYYDQAFGISGEAELAWYLSMVDASGGPVLDLACGTGRLAILLANEGYEVTAIDQSAGMLDQFKAKLQGHSSELAERIHIDHQKMSDFELGMKFNTVICCDAFFHNLTVDDEISCLSSIVRHLTTDGHFVFNLPNPTCDFLLRSVASAGRDFETRGRYPLEGSSDNLLVEQAQSCDLQQQLITTTLRITRYDPQGNEVEKGESNWMSRYLFKHEAIHLLYGCGLEVRSLVGDYRNGPITEEGQLIFDVKLINTDIV